jgi:hypothetical protein|eukprot:CAMPEP_0174287750 /NCGR_PEP_ID=MMETSP0809-20121228/17415_1 /TAXON_ID=73025 ORGANISM="Eutreptiella gymnastica-like, Strain CCMP1594" /NCGR_SAMPLE_ID=MMETSP0809 /ASSEMBLY_ACC=CAM_ASM_000658 /LENGTH=169 /DNA_ID=CAMNT_0015384483 /DNA_START=37 /DNA_END=546 /DNA_ORIENTATION=+
MYTESANGMVVSVTEQPQGFSAKRVAAKATLYVCVAVFGHIALTHLVSRSAVPTHLSLSTPSQTTQAGLKAPLVAKHHEPVVPSGTDKAVKPNLVAAKTAAAATAMAGLVPPAFGYDEIPAGVDNVYVPGSLLDRIASVPFWAIIISVATFKEVWPYIADALGGGSDKK